MATDITLSSTKGSPLTHAEVDANFENLKETADKKANTEALGVEADDTNMGSTAGAILSDDARSEEHTSELQSLMRISYAVFCLKKKKKKTRNRKETTEHETKDKNLNRLMYE